jgi:hypothetical protein
MLIRNDIEYREAKARMEDFRRQASLIRKALTARGVTEEKILDAIAPHEMKSEDLAWDAALYERLRAGDVDAVPPYPPAERGEALICLRVVKGWTQRQLANALGVSEAVVSRDERNRYHGMTPDRYGKVLHALGFVEHARFATACQSEPERPRRVAEPKR